MVTVFIDLADITGKEDLHGKIRRRLAPVSYEGNNLDALHDVLTEYSGLPVIRFYNADSKTGPMAEYISRLRRMCEAAMRENPSLTIEFE